MADSISSPVQRRPGNVITQAHDQVRAHVRAGDWVVDATAGDGQDTLFLSLLVGISGRVFAFDIQNEALTQTRLRLESEHASAQVTLLDHSHAELARHLPPQAEGRLSAVMFNLGYLPSKGRGSLTTQVGSTVSALEQASAWLSPGGILSVIAYRGHPGGEDESLAVAHFFSQRLELWEITESIPPPSALLPPILRTARKPSLTT
ncbi:MAG TPA: class I SAM-dependent methyltransferase [Opitutaceae bacterium]|nr:class I SAM-dependent methyltransferase [Opitutaceae bacterium]